MKAACLSLLFICLLQHAFSQLSGKVNSAAGKPIPFANVLLLSSNDSTLAKAVLTDENGAYSMDAILQGKYFLRLSSTGYITWNSPVFEITGSENRKDFGTQVLKANDNILEEVVIRAEKPLFQQKPEGTIVHVENSILTKGSSALQVLERSPGVVINHRDNSIELNGKSGVMVMLNGKMMRLPMEQVVSLLNSMSADEISSIELLTTPPAKYDAEGSAGLINIVLKKNKKQGTNASVSLTGGYGRGEKATGSINISHNTKYINLYGSYTFSHNSTYSELFITGTQHMPFLGGDIATLFKDTTKVVRDNHDATIGIDINPDTKTTIGTSSAFNSSTASRATYNNALYNVLPDSLLQFTGINKGTNYWNSAINTIYMERRIKEGEKINIDLDYLYFKNDGPYQVQSSFIDKHGAQAGTDESLFSPRQKGFAHTTIQVGVIKTDYTKQLTKKLTLETGIKGTHTRSSSMSGIESLIDNVWTGSDQTTNHIDMKEWTGAAYASVNTQLNTTTRLTAGLRYEYSYTDMGNPETGKKIISRKLGSLFPGIFFSKKINDKTELQISYTKRITRPSYNDLASYVGYSDPTAVYTGNPFLKPTITHNIKVGYTYKRYSFSLLFSRDNYPISRYQLTESPAADILYISPQNLRWQHNITFQTNIPVRVNKWWTMSNGFVGGLRQYKVDYTPLSFEKSYFAYALNFSQAFTLPGNFSAELSARYNNTFYNGTVKIDGYGIIDIGIKKVLQNNAGSFQLSVSDLLRNEKINVYYGTLSREAFDVKSQVKVTTETGKFPIIKLTYSKTFGGNKAKVQRGKGYDDEQSRVRKE